jgi:hypothetical protein
LRRVPRGGVGRFGEEGGGREGEFVHETHRIGEWSESVSEFSALVQNYQETFLE